MKFFEPLEIKQPKKRGRKPKGEIAMTTLERDKSRRQKEKQKICVLDMETDPFDSQSKSPVHPFAACLYSDHFEPVVIWEENNDRFVKSVLGAIEALEGRYIIYAHNGGRFDFMFLVHKLRGAVSFKGRGIMSASIGEHELRDSFHLIPEKLASYQKDSFDYSNLTKAKRNAHRQTIIDYMVADCRYLLDLLRDFVGEFGLKMSIGQAAMHELTQKYEWKKMQPGWDEYLRGYFFGGRVECLTGRSHVRGEYKLYDVNSMYPFVMATCRHPVGDFFDYDMRLGDPGEHTVFVDLDCENNGALIGKTPDGETTAGIRSGRFFTTIHEFKAALRFNLIRNVRVNYCLDCKEQTDFREFVEPLYQRRQLTKTILGDLKKTGDENSREYLEAKRSDLFLKLLMNNAYGKFAQNPRRFKEYYLTDPDELPPAEWFASLEKLKPDEQLGWRVPESENEAYWIWHKPSPGFRFNNVGTAASITGAARAYLLEALQSATDPIYCDTDSIICRALEGVEIDREKLGAWDLEAEFSEVIINGKKLYSCRYSKPWLGPGGQIIEYKIRSKGSSGLSWSDMVDIFNGETVEKTNFGPTLTRHGSQYYLSRKIQATAKPKEGAL